MTVRVLARSVARDRPLKRARFGVDDEDFWAVPDHAPTTDIDGHQATVLNRTVHNGTPDSAPAVTVIWQGEYDWTAVTGSGSYADASRVETIAEFLRDQPQ